MGRNITIIIMVILTVCLLSHIASADIGPKPSLDIFITLEGSNVNDQVFYAKMYSCEEENFTYTHDIVPQLNFTVYDGSKSCYWVPAALAWNYDCEISKCHFSYHLPENFRLGVYLPSTDKVYMSQEVERYNFRSTFDADLKSDGTMVIIETTPLTKSDNGQYIKLFFIALLITVLMEVAVGTITLLFKFPKRILQHIVIINIITLPIVWFLFSKIPNFFWMIVLAEIFAFVTEAAFYHYFSKISKTKAIILSAMANITSFIIGGMLLTFIFLVVMFRM